MIFINFKSYASGTGEKAIKIASFCQKYSKTSTVLVPAVQATDLFRLSKALTVPIWAQSADAKEPFQNTGHITPFALKESHAAGFFINHTDHPKTAKEIKQLVVMAKNQALQTLIFAKNEQELNEYDQFGANYLSLEDPSLIASDTAMVDKYETQLRSLSQTLETPFVIGAGIRTKEHYRKALGLGAVGVVLSSQIMEAEDPEKAIRELVL